MALETAIRFTTDIVGLERTLRFLQASLQIVVSYPALLSLVSTLSKKGWSGSKAVKGQAAGQHVMTHDILVGVRDQVNVTRRFFRIFRFIESFYMAHKLFEALVFGKDAQTQCSGDKNRKRHQFELWMDALSRAFLGMHLFTEVLVLPDVIGVYGLEVWGPKTAHLLNIEAQRFWFFALFSGLIASLSRLANVLRDLPLPATTEAETTGKRGSPLVDFDDNDDDDNQNEEKAFAALNEERERLRRIVRLRTNQRMDWRRAIRARYLECSRRVLAEGLDLCLPGSTLGWIPCNPGTVGVIMVITSVLTGWDAWKRCKTDVSAEKGN